MDDRVNEILLNLPWAKRLMAKKGSSDSIPYAQHLLADCIQSGKLIRESDGQFTGGVGSEVWRHADMVYEFFWEKGELFMVDTYDGELYE